MEWDSNNWEKMSKKSGKNLPPLEEVLNLSKDDELDSLDNLFNELYEEEENTMDALESYNDYKKLELIKSILGNTYLTERLVESYGLSDLSTGIKSLVDELI